MRAAAEELARNGSTDHPLLAAYFLAEHVNRHAGGAVVAPWDIQPGYDLEDWIDAAVTLSEVPRIQRSQSELGEYLQKRRAAHPNYSRYRH